MSGESVIGGALPADYSALVVTASNRAAAGVYEDKGGPLVAGGLAECGFAVDGPWVVPDGDPVEEALRSGVEAGYDVIVTTGGTGISPTDRTPRRPGGCSTTRSRESRKPSGRSAGTRCPRRRSREGSPESPGGR